MRPHLKIDYWLLTPALILIVISLTVLYSLDASLFTSQLISSGVGLLAFFIFSQTNLNIFKELSFPVYIASLVIFVIILLLGIESRGAVRWVTIFGVSLQFSELLKPFLAIAFATYLSQQEYPNKRVFFLSLALLAPVFLLITLQPDLGSGLVYVGAAIFTLFALGFPLLWFGLAVLPFVIMSPILWNVMHEYQRQRILTFLHPTADPLGTSYNSIQAMIAVGSGSFFGKGLFEGTQSGLDFLPERHTDFIFATLSEGLGFFGALLVIALFLFLFYRIYVIFQQSDDLFTRAFASCTFAILLIQFFVNVGMNIGIMPIVGITLPFVSFGGSSLLSNFIFLGILSALSTSNKNKRVLQIR